MIAYDIHELQEAGLFPILIEHVWDINFILPEDSPLGMILKGLIAYNGNPSLLEAIAYLTALAVTIAYLLRQRQLHRPTEQLVQTTTTLELEPIEEQG